MMQFLPEGLPKSIVTQTCIFGYFFLMSWAKILRGEGRSLSGVSAFHVPLVNCITTENLMFSFGELRKQMEDLVAKSYLVRRIGS